MKHKDILRIIVVILAGCMASTSLFAQDLNILGNKIINEILSPSLVSEKYSDSPRKDSLIKIFGERDAPNPRTPWASLPPDKSGEESEKNSSVGPGSGTRVATFEGSVYVEERDPAGNLTGRVEVVYAGRQLHALTGQPLSEPLPSIEDYERAYRDNSDGVLTREEALDLEATKLVFGINEREETLHSLVNKISVAEAGIIAGKKRIIKIVGQSMPGDFENIIKEFAQQKGFVVQACSVEDAMTYKENDKEVVVHIVNNEQFSPDIKGRVLILGKIQAIDEVLPPDVAPIAMALASVNDLESPLARELINLLKKINNNPDIDINTILPLIDSSRRKDIDIDMLIIKPKKVSNEINDVIKALRQVLHQA